MSGADEKDACPACGKMLARLTTTFNSANDATRYIRKHKANGVQCPGSQRVAAVRVAVGEAQNG